MNWFHPLIWLKIDTMAKKTQFSACRLVANLKIHDTITFGGLNSGTVQRWFARDESGCYEKAWSKKILARVDMGHATFGTGRVGVLKQFPEVVEKIKAKFIELRGKGIAINRNLAQSLMLAIIKVEQPDVLTKMKCSEV